MLCNKPVAVLGGGNGAHALAADLTARGFQVNLYEMPGFKGNMQKVFETKEIIATGVIEGTFPLNKVTDDIEYALAGVKYIIILTPAFAHDAYARLLKGKVSSDQVIVSVPGAFAALKLRKELGDDCPTLVDANNLMYDVRLTGPGRVHILELDTIEIGFMPADREKLYIDELREMFDISGVFSDVLECGLALVNPALHSGPCILNAGPIEYRNNDFYLYEHGFTPSASKIDKKIDDERKAVARGFGYDVNPFRCFPNIKHLEERGEEYTWQDLYRAAHGDIGLTPISGPNDIRSRYLTEDAPCGLVPWSQLAGVVGVETRTIDSIVDLYSVFHETDWWKEGTLLSDLGLEGMSVEEIKHYCRSGVKKYSGI